LIDLYRIEAHESVDLSRRDLAGFGPRIHGAELAIEQVGQFSGCEQLNHWIQGPIFAYENLSACSILYFSWPGITVIELDPFVQIPKWG